MDPILARFKEFSPLVVAAAGLMDGINPCAFATLTLFISYLTLAKYPKRQTFLAGIAFILSMFLTYTVMGFGAFRLLQAMMIYDLASRILYLAAAALAVTLGSVALYDFILSRQGRGAGDFKLKLPAPVRERIRLMLRREYLHSAPGNFTENVIGAMATAFGLGFFIAFLEGACTGQLYLPTLVFVAQVPELRLNALLYLILYNLMFILPLIGIFSLVLSGLYSEKLSLFYREHLDIIKLALAIIFLGLGFFLLINL
jgi:cytochrome c biogenesis protein CcdA